MKIFRWLIVVSLLTFKAGDSSCQIIKTSDFYDSIKKYDLSKLWTKDSLIVEASIRHKFPEILGYIGGSYQRFYIHYFSIAKNRKDPYGYIVKGKTKVGNNICDFRGTIDIKQAFFYKDEDSMGFQLGIAICDCDFYEDSLQKESGHIHGQMQTFWYLDKGQIHYDDIKLQADDFSNNQFVGTWTHYKNKSSLKCNWGDFRIPESGDLDSGTGEFAPNDKYLGMGWGSYWDATISGDTIKQKKAMEIENKKWWK